MKMKILSLSIMVAVAGNVSASEWFRYGGDTSNTHQSSHGPAKSKVSKLKRSVNFLPSSYILGVNLESAISSQLVGKGNHLYYGDYSGAVIKRNQRTGEIVWKTMLPEGGSVRSTPLIDGDTIWVVNYTSTVLHKLDRKTGAVLLSTRLTDYPVGSKVWHNASGSPVIASVGNKRLIIQGLDGGQNIPYLFDANGNVVNNSVGKPAGLFTDQADKLPGQQQFDLVGQIIAVDADNGEIVWRRNVNDKPGEFGMGVWSTVAIDEKNGFGYIGTGQSYNPPASANSCAILKFKLKTGDIVDSFSFHPTPMTRMESCVYSAEYIGGDPAIPTAGDPIGNGRDLAYYNQVEIDGNFYGDNDVGSAPILYSVKVNGTKTMNVVASINKAGRIRAFNRDNGNMIWERVISTTAGSSFANPGLSYEKGVVYAASVNDLNSNNRRQFNLNNGLATILDTASVLIGPAILNSTQISALDGSDGHALWANDPVIAGHTISALTLSKDVLYHVSFDSNVRAFDRSTGLQLSTAEPLGPTTELFQLPCVPPATCAAFSIRSIPGNSATFLKHGLFIPTGIEAMGPGIPDGGIYKYSVKGK